MENNTQDAVGVQYPYKKERKLWYRGEKVKYTDDKRWISLYWSKSVGIRFVWSPASYFDSRMHIAITLLWVRIGINLPIWSTIHECEYPEYGFYWEYGPSLVLCWNMKKKFIHMPWEMEWVRTSKLRSDGTWYIERKGDVKKYRKEHPNYTMSEIYQWEQDRKGTLWTETHFYPYTTKYGEVQNDTNATIKVSETEWRPRWFMWTGLFKKIRKYIDVEFDKEVGSERGSWKGGTIGCSYTMNPGETPYQTLMRMNKERSFDR